MTRRLPLLLCAVAACAAAWAADLPSAWRNWRYSRPVTDLSVSARTPAEIRLPWDVFSRSEARGADFRLIDNRGQEVPFEITFAKGESRTETESRPSKILERSFVPGQFTQVVIRVTDKPPLDESHGVTLDQLQAEPWFNTIHITTSENDFMYWVEIAVSDDAHEWRILDARSPISRFRKHGLEGNQTLQFDGYSNQRFLRLRIFDPEHEFPVGAVEILSHSSHEPERSPLPGTFTSEESFDKAASRWRADLGVSSFPVSELAIIAGQPEFYRAVRVSTSNDGKEWNQQVAGQIYRYTEGAKSRESLRIDFPEMYAQYWRVEIINGNDQPLANARPELRGLPRMMIFRSDPGRAYCLLYGNLAAKWPQYDVTHVFAGFPPKMILPVLSLRDEEVNSAYTDPRPFTERHPVVLWVTLGIAIAVLGFAALRALRAGPEQRTE